MFLDLFAAFAAGFIGAGLALILRRLSGGRVPRPLIPIAAGAAMLGMAIWSEYTWFDRTVAAFPSDVAVVSTNKSTSMIRPWSYLFPFVNRFTAVDLASKRVNKDVPGKILAEMLLVQRHGFNAKIPVMVDCAGTRWTELADGFVIDETGEVEGADWRGLASDDPLLTSLC